MLKRGIGKKGSGHLEMMFAFVFFVGFIFFLFLIIKPYDMEVLPDSIARGIASSFERETSTNFTLFYLKLDYSGVPSSTNINVAFPEKKLFEYDISEAEAIVLNAETNEGIASHFTKASTTLTIKNDTQHFKVLFSPEFLPTAPMTSTATIPQNQIVIGNLFERKVLSNRSIDQLKTIYEGNYNDLKFKLGVPKVYDFSIISPDIPELNMNRQPPSSVDVYAQTFIFEVINSDGTLINARFIISVW